MNKSLQCGWVNPLWLVLCLTAVAADERPYGKGLTDANKESLPLDAAADVQLWQNGSPDETHLAHSDKGWKGRPALLFANRVDHTKGEKSYPVGWPRTALDLAKRKLTDWSVYDAFECWIYAETSREKLPGSPLGVNFQHSGRKQSSSFPLNTVRKKEWVKIVVPIVQIKSPSDVQRVQFNISESNYRHGDQVDFYISQPALTRYVDPAVSELAVRRQVLFGAERVVEAEFRLAGHKDLERTTVECSVGQDGAAPAARTTVKAARSGEAAVTISTPLRPGPHWFRLDLRDAAGRLIDRKQCGFRVVQGPF